MTAPVFQKNKTVIGQSLFEFIEWAKNSSAVVRLGVCTGHAPRASAYPAFSGLEREENCRSLGFGPARICRLVCSIS